MTRGSAASSGMHEPSFNCDDLTQRAAACAPLLEFGPSHGIDLHATEPEIAQPAPCLDHVEALSGRVVREHDEEIPVTVRAVISASPAAEEPDVRRSEDIHDPVSASFSASRRRCGHRERRPNLPGG